MVPVARTYQTALGPMRAEATSVGLARLHRVDPVAVVNPVGQDRDGQEQVEQGPELADPDGADPDCPAARHLARLGRQLDDYCAGRLRRFDLPVDWDAAGVYDEFSREVYREIRAIPYGHTSAYGQVAIDAGRPRNARRVGRLCSLVPVSLVLPVHRVIRADGGLGRCPDYRLRLLEHERRNLTSAAPVALPVDPDRTRSR